MNTETIIARIDFKLKEELEKLAKEKGLSISSLVRMILKEYFD